MAKVGPYALVLLLSLVLAGCRSREVEKDLKLIDVKTGWYDAGIVNGENKLVPSVYLKLQNVSAEEIASVDLNAIFRREGEQESWGDHFAKGIDRNGLAAGATGKPLVLRSPRGYTGPQSRIAMLQHKEFRDANVTVFGKHGSRGWVKLGEFKIDRQLLTE